MKKFENIANSKFKNLLALCVLALTFLMVSAVSVYADDDDDIKPKKIYAASKKTITVTAGDEFELKVRTSPGDADDDHLRWKIISGSKYVAFDDDDRDDDEAEMKAKKAGTAKVRCYIKGTKKYVTFTVKVKAGSQKIKAVGPKKIRVEVGDDFELKVKKYSGLNDRYLKWSIQNKRIVSFDDDDRTDDEVEFEARRTGTTKIYCKNKKTKQTITYNGTVI